MSKILVVDDEPSICWGLSRLAEGLGHQVQVASSAEQGLSAAKEFHPELIVLDVRLPGVDGLTAMKLFRSLNEQTPIIVITAFGDLKTAVTAVEQGAFEYILKPFDLHEIRTAIERSLRRTPAAAVEAVNDAASAGLEGMLGRSPAMQAAFKRIALAAASDAAVLLKGESGVGKELAAQAIHRHSPRASGPFVAVNMGALNTTLGEAELFGHVEGTFTGATQTRRGLLAQANGGTLFIDEVADIPAPIQAKLLRALDQDEVLPVGADQPVKTQFRIVSATHQDLHQLVERGEFRHDLFYRLCTFEIPLPALRERSQDIPLLANYFASQFGDGRAVLAAETVDELSQRPWHGNVRELRKAIEHALVLARSGSVLPSHLPAPLPAFQSNGGKMSPEGRLNEAVTELAQQLLKNPELNGDVYYRFLQVVEKPLLATALSQAGNQCAPAARVLGLHRTTLKRKLDQHGIAENGAEH
ncbi:sigma-54-dependent transcriptional regulator [Lacipirellula sp.]|uniref:sigma-54-dependent transcriptional regulator n=1 Tax=Lacipirellula sp. TaxID=2691419 RepID=UPI003D0A6C8D